MSKHTPEPWENFSELCEPYSANPDSDGFVRLDFYDALNTNPSQAHDPRMSRRYQRLRE